MRPPPQQLATACGTWLSSMFGDAGNRWPLLTGAEGGLLPYAPGPTALPPLPDTQPAGAEGVDESVPWCSRPPGGLLPANPSKMSPVRTELLPPPGVPTAASDSAPDMRRATAITAALLPLLWGKACVVGGCEEGGKREACCCCC